MTYLADFLARTTPASTTWVAGGVYRQVRRDCSWSDAPTLDLHRPDFAPVQNLPLTMRIYTLERSLSREEKAHEQSSAQNDLIGRDAEKAELHAAYHMAVSGLGGVNAGGIVTTRAVVGEL